MSRCSEDTDWDNVDMIRAIRKKDIKMVKCAIEKNSPVLWEKATYEALKAGNLEIFNLIMSSSPIQKNMIQKELLLEYAKYDDFNINMFNYLMDNRYTINTGIDVDIILEYVFMDKQEAIERFKPYIDRWLNTENVYRILKRAVEARNTDLLKRYSNKVSTRIDFLTDLINRAITNGFLEPFMILINTIEIPFDQIEPIVAKCFRQRRISFIKELLKIKAFKDEILSDPSSYIILLAIDETKLREMINIYTSFGIPLTSDDSLRSFLTQIHDTISEKDKEETILNLVNNGFDFKNRVLPYPVSQYSFIYAILTKNDHDPRKDKILIDSVIDLSDTLSKLSQLVNYNPAKYVKWLNPHDKHLIKLLKGKSLEQFLVESGVSREFIPIKSEYYPLFGFTKIKPKIPRVPLTIMNKISNYVGMYENPEVTFKKLTYDVIRNLDPNADEKDQPEYRYKNFKLFPYKVKNDIHFIGVFNGGFAFTIENIIGEQVFYFSNIRGNTKQYFRFKEINILKKFMRENNYFPKDEFPEGNYTAGQDNDMDHTPLGSIIIQLMSILLKNNYNSLDNINSFIETYSIDLNKAHKLVKNQIIGNIKVLVTKKETPLENVFLGFKFLKRWFPDVYNTGQMTDIISSHEEQKTSL